MRKMGKTRKALRSLECAMESGMMTVAQIEADSYLEPLRGEDDYRESLEHPDGSP